MNNTYVKLMRWLITLAMPFFLGFAAITLIINDIYPRYQYSNPDFPTDPFGLTYQQRLDLALVAVNYLQRFEPAEEIIYLLEEQQIPGVNEPLYNQREIGHMVDVKNVTDNIRIVAIVSGIIVIGGLVILLWRPETRVDAYRAMFQGGLLTTFILIAIALFIVLAWSLFFTQFHELFFPPGTWTFSYSDSLIRLFPEKFWFDLGVILSVGTLVAGFIVGLIGFFLLRRSGREQNTLTNE